MNENLVHTATKLVKVGRAFLVSRTRVTDGPQRPGASQIVAPSGSTQGRITLIGSCTSLNNHQLQGVQEVWKYCTSVVAV